jgi:hypothetical protein
MMYDPKEKSKSAPVKKEMRWQRFKRFLQNLKPKVNATVKLFL